MRRLSLFVFLAGAALLATGALAAPPEAPWVTRDIGEPYAPGSTDVDANGVWTLKGSGDDIFGFADSFQFAYQPVRGDGSISARFLSRSGGNSSWAKAGLMIRESDANGAPNLNLTMTPQVGIHATMRRLSDEFSQSFNTGAVGPTNSTQRNLFMRLQRVGNEIAGFYSRDGVLWTPASFSPPSIPTLREEALFGLAVSSVQEARVTTGQFDQVKVQQGIVSVYGIKACGGDRRVLLQWRPLPAALGVNLYRGPAGATADQLTKLNDQPIAGTSFTDSREGLVNGTPVTYAIAPVFKGADGNPIQGPVVTVQATPVAIPAGWLGCGIEEGPRLGSATVDAATGQITLRGSGDYGGAGDQCYFLSQIVEGDFQVTVRSLTRPTDTPQTAKPALMIRESLDASARDAYLLMGPSRGLVFEYRATTSGDADAPIPAIERASFKTPILLRLTRKGRTITSAYSTDDGKTFQPAAAPLTFDEDLPRALYVGLAVCSLDHVVVKEAKFSDFVIEKQ
jgi:hypothetical protein